MWKYLKKNNNRIPENLFTFPVVNSSHFLVHKNESAFKTSSADSFLLLDQGFKSTVHPAQVVDPKHPKKYIDTLPGFRNLVPPVGIIRLRDALVNGNGIILTKEGHLLSDSPIAWAPLTVVKGYLEFDENYKRIPKLKDALHKRSPVETIDDPAVFLGSLAPAHYSHFLYELFARLAVLDKAKWLFSNFQFLIPDCDPIHDESSQHRKLLSASGISGNSIRTIPVGPWVQVRELYIPSRVINLETGGYFCWPDAIAYIHRISKNISDPKEKCLRSPFVYITRRDASTRLTANEEEIEHMLVEKGFQIVIASELSMEQKVEVFSGAKIIAGANGNGVISSPFMAPGSSLLTLTTRFLERTIQYQTMFCKYNSNPIHILYESVGKSLPGKGPYAAYGFYSYYSPDALSDMVDRIKNSYPEESRTAHGELAQLAPPPVDSPQCEKEAQRLSGLAMVWSGGRKTSQFMSEIINDSESSLAVYVFAESNNEQLQIKTQSIVQLPLEVAKSIPLNASTAFWQELAAKYAEKSIIIIMKGFTSVESCRNLLRSLQPLINEKTQILLDHTVPIEISVGSSKRNGMFWAGDTFRLIPALRKKFQKAQIQSHMTYPYGFTEIKGIGGGVDISDALNDPDILENNIQSPAVFSSELLRCLGFGDESLLNLLEGR